MVVIVNILLRRARFVNFLMGGENCSVTSLLDYVHT